MLRPCNYIDVGVVSCVHFSFPNFYVDTNKKLGHLLKEHPRCFKSSREKEETQENTNLMYIVNHIVLPRKQS